MRIVSGRFRGKSLKSPVTQDIRPTSDRVRESLFNILASRIGPQFQGQRVLDLFAGTGALGLEAMSRGADFVCFIDTGIEARGIIRDHIVEFGLAGQSKLLKRDVTDLGPVERFQPFSLVFLDPPYAKGLGEKALASALQGGWLAAGAQIVWEESKGTPINIPSELTLDDERIYGDTVIRILTRS